MIDMKARLYLKKVSIQSVSVKTKESNLAIQTYISRFPLSLDAGKHLHRKVSFQRHRPGLTQKYNLHGIFTKFDENELIGPTYYILSTITTTKRNTLNVKVFYICT